MIPSNPADGLRTISASILVADLLKQFNKPTLLGRSGISLSKSQMDAIAIAVENHDTIPQRDALIETMHSIIAESITELQTRFQMTFAESLAQQDMSEIGGWETTSDFLEIANHKSNAELRISAGATLLAFLGDFKHLDVLLTVFAVDGGVNDVDAMLARRALGHRTQVDFDAPDWEDQLKRAIKD